MPGAARDKETISRKTDKSVACYTPQFRMIIWWASRAERRRGSHSLGACRSASARRICLERHAMNERSIFLEALDKPQPERAMYLDAACGGDMSIRQRIEKLLAAHDNGTGLLDHPAVSEPNTA